MPTRREFLLNSWVFPTVSLVSVDLSLVVWDWEQNIGLLWVSGECFRNGESIAVGTIMKREDALYEVIISISDEHTDRILAISVEDAKRRAQRHMERFIRSARLQ